MKEKNYTNLIPENTKGKEITAIAYANFDKVDAAISYYRIVKERLLFIEHWQNLAGGISARFQLTDAKGTEVHRRAEKGDHIRIDIPGPGSKAGEGYDWVRIEEIKEINSGEVDSIGIIVRPAPNPNTDNSNIAHFYAGQSTSTFVVTREHSKLTASVYDRNIESNEESKELLDKVRNAVVGLGAKQGFSKLQWQALAEGLLQPVE
jgi:hypothetical protein